MTNIFSDRPQTKPILSVKPELPTLVPISINCSLGEDEGNPKASYAAIYNPAGHNVHNGTASWVTKFNSVKNDSGVYGCEVGNYVGSSNRSEAEVVVRGKVTVP